MGTLDTTRLERKSESAKSEKMKIILYVVLAFCFQADLLFGLKCWHGSSNPPRECQLKGKNPTQAQIEQRCELRECHGNCTREWRWRGNVIELDCKREEKHGSGCSSTDSSDEGPGSHCVCVEDGCNVAWPKFFSPLEGN